MHDRAVKNESFPHQTLFLHNQCGDEQRKHDNELILGAFNEPTYIN